MFFQRSYTRLISSRCRFFHFSAKTDQRIRVGDVEMPMRIPSKDESYLIPSKFLPSSPSQIYLSHLRWMMAKDSLKQDMMLIGPPGSSEVFRRRLALAFAESMQKPIEILTISADTTESDLKQRRELVHRHGQTNVDFVDQAPVRAAKHGRLLLLDGIEKAERNILPTLNNLLENREMNLEDGCLLLPPHRVQELQHTAISSGSSSSWIPVHPDFRVIALGVPSPPFAGRSLDPPLRSRFQIRRVDNPLSEELYEQLVEENIVPMFSKDLTNRNEELSLARKCAVLADSMQQNGKFFPSNNLGSIWRVLTDFPLEAGTNILTRSYPIAGNDLSSKGEEFQDFVGYFNQPATYERNSESFEKISRYEIRSIERVIKGGDLEDPIPKAKVDFDYTGVSKSDDRSASTITPCGKGPVNKTSSTRLVHTPGFQRALAAMVQEHASGNRDILLVSPKGEGKNALAQEFAAKLGYETHLFAVNSDMSSQDLLLRRTTDPMSGETKWEESPLLMAARAGDVCILDGIEKLRPDVLSSLQSLMTDRDLPLPDGRRVLRHNRTVYQDPDANDTSISVHPCFRVVALASVSKNRPSISEKWMTPSLMSMFSTISLTPPTEDCLREILRKNASFSISEKTIYRILSLRENLKDSVAEECGVNPLSTRNMIRAVRRLGNEDAQLYHVLASIFLFDLLPPRQRSILGSIMNKSGITESTDSNDGFSDKDLSVTIDKNTAKIGTLTMERGIVNRPQMVPSPQAFDIPAHLKIIQDLLTDWKNGEKSILLLGNQGVGKNKIVDRLCEIANFEREYIQLHRDSTIGQLTLAPQLEDGKIVWNDSPLVRAVRDGCALVVDEADKAPVEVVSVLKGLVEDGELMLADGRRISRHSEGPKIIKMHPNFSLWVLANRPGFPFLGNDFFREVGDCFSVRVISNPDLNSEMSLLRSYAPGLDTGVIRKIASSFAELRHYADNGDISYPYSTREAIAVVKHLEKFPNDGLVASLHNVLDFDSYDDQTYALLGKVFQRHGIGFSDYSGWKESLGDAGPFSTNGKNPNDLRIEYIDADGKIRTSPNPPSSSMPKFGKWDEENEVHVGGNQWAGGTGGSDTAGLGGRGGPFRLDRGHKVHQVSEEAKAEVSQEAKEAARKIAEKALKDRLEEIGMDNQEWTMYERFANSIREDVSRLKGILNGIELKSSERGWLKHQSHGEIDDSKLIDGATGDKYIYKRRGSMEDSPMPRKKRIRFVVDVSGSMYRFNSYDERLIRCLEAALLIMESFQSVKDSNKFEYSIVGHSGDSPSVPLIDWGLPPDNEMERLRILQTMLAHSQYCRSGDFTLEALSNAIDNVSSSGDDGTVICLSDANLARYGIDPRQLGMIIEEGSMKGVKAYLIFIASFGDEAKEIARSLPIGRGYICMETSELPRIVRDILTSQVLK